MNLAVDKATLVDKIFFGLTTPAINELDNTPWANKALKPYPFDAAQARQLLDQAGWAVGADGIRTKNGVRAEVGLSTTTGNPTRDQIQALVQQNLHDVGIAIKIENYPAPKFFADWDKGGILYGRGANLMQFYNGLQGVDPDLSYWWHSKEIATPERKAGGNRSGWSNPQLDKLLDERVVTADAARVKEILDQAQQLIYDGYPMIPLVNRALIAGFSKKIGNYQVVDALANAGMVDNIADWTKE
jgi:peptide/nickel transport system substrate-binding protein